MWGWSTSWNKSLTESRRSETELRSAARVKDRLVPTIRNLKKIRSRILMIHINLITETNSLLNCLNLMFRSCEDHNSILLRWRQRSEPGQVPREGRRIRIPKNVQDYRRACFQHAGDWIDTKTLPDSRQCTQVRNLCSLMHSGSVYPITALIKPQCFPSDIIKVLHQTVMGSVLTVSSARFTQQQHVFMFPYRPIREAQEVGFFSGHQSEMFHVFPSVWSVE